VWDYIKAKELKDPTVKGTYKCDADLKAVFKQDTFQVKEVS
jgi:chromatin remodeling complex protein RSC6